MDRLVFIRAVKESTSNMNEKPLYFTKKGRNDVDALHVKELEDKSSLQKLTFCLFVFYYSNITAYKYVYVCKWGVLCMKLTSVCAFQSFNVSSPSLAFHLSHLMNQVYHVYLNHRRTGSSFIQSVHHEKSSLFVCFLSTCCIFLFKSLL